MRYRWLVMLTLLAGCSKAPDGQSASESAAPGVAVSSAPGVAFDYRYAFRLPPSQVSVVQEAHARACEELGLARCRISAMRYQLVGENDVQAMLAFRLDPAIARRFGRAAIDRVSGAKGTLVDAQITGTDAGTEIARLERDEAGATAERQRLDAELAKPGRPPSERAELQRQRAAVATDVKTAASGAAEQRDSLAKTPMVFDYASGPAIRGFDASAPLASALDMGIASVQTTLAAFLGIIAIFGPPGLVLVLLWLLWRRVGLPAWRRLTGDNIEPA